MLDETIPTAETQGAESAPEAKAPAKKTAAKKAPAKKAAAKKAVAKKAPAKKAASAPVAETADADSAPAAKKTAAKKAPAKTAAKKTAATKAAPKKQAEPAPVTFAEDEEVAAVATKPAARAVAPPVVLFQAPEPVPAQRRRQPAKPKPVVEDEVAASADSPAEESAETVTEPQATRPPRAPRTPKAPRPEQQDEKSTGSEDAEDADENDDDDDETGSGARRRRRRGGRRRRKPSDGENEGSENSEDGDSGDSGDSAETGDDSDESGEGGTTKRRRVRVRDGEGRQSDDPNTVTRVRPSRTGEDQITSISGSTRLEAKKQRRRDGREAGRRRAPIVSEAEFLARREAVDRVMVIRQRKDLTQIAVLEDKVLVEHYVARESQTSLIGNVYLGRVQNVLPSMEAAFIDIGKGRNAVLYAGEVNWSSLGHRDGQPRKIEQFLSSGQQVLVQVTKDPVGHKGARLTSQVSLAGRFLVYVPDGTTSGISRKLPDTERGRLKALLKEIVPDTAGVIVRTAAEGASEEELTHDVERLKTRWEEIEKQTKGNTPGPKLLYGEPDLTLKVVRDLFTEDFAKLVIQGKDAWDTVQGYVRDVAPDLEERLERYDADTDVFATYRIDEQIAKGLDRKVWLPSGGSLVIDRTEAMTVVDVNTGKFTGSGGNLEETVTKNNLEAAEEIVRQLRLRDIGGIIVVDFIDMVLESNRDLVLRRMVECLGRDRTRHQVAEVTSLGLVQMTRKRIGTGLVEAFSENCEHCQGRGVVIHNEPIEAKGGVSGAEEPRRGGRRNRGGRGGQGDQPRQDGAKSDAPQGDAPKGETTKTPATPPTPKDVAAVARPDATPVMDADDELVGVDDGAPVAEPTEVPVVETSVEEAPVEVPVEVDAEVAPVEEAPVAEPAEPAAPKVITRTRRAASRPAGSTAGTTAPAAIVVPEAPVALVEHTPVVEPPKVITRTRKVATRPAGAGAAAAPAPVAAEASQDAPAPADAPADEESEHVELHVPIKKKGARKR